MCEPTDARRQSWDLSFFPLMENQPYDRFGDPYDVKRVLNDDHEFDPAKFAEYSPLYLPASYAITYLVAFALASAMIVHTLLYHSRTLLHGLTQTRIEKDDIHAKLMRAYPEVPDWWYALTFLLCFGMAFLTAEVRCCSAFLMLSEMLISGCRCGIRTFPCGRCFSRLRSLSSISCLPDTSTR